MRPRTPSGGVFLGSAELVGKGKARMTESLSRHGRLAGLRSRRPPAGAGISGLRFRLNAAA